MHDIDIGSVDNSTKDVTQEITKVVYGQCSDTTFRMFAAESSIWSGSSPQISYFSLFGRKKNNNSVTFTKNKMAESARLKKNRRTCSIV